MPTKRKTRPAAAVQPIHPCLWFDSEAEEAARFYVSVFKKAKILQISRYPAVGQEIHGRAPGSVMTVDFVLNGLTFTALNGGPVFKFNEAVSLQVMCRTQKDPKSKRTERAFAAMMQMKKLDIAALEAAYNG